MMVSACPSLFLWSTGGYFQERECLVSGTITLDMAVTGQENSRENGLLQGMGKVWEFHFESGKIDIFERSRGKVKF